ncbi:hypothetical protein OSSY52_22570 [Tepiditoga spiralis]|uniref:Uncharacterized protein n=1 Tax=Tepiditoga spiralis TaxID=2108365 RepID=A0A7G1G9E1_9BACT|nr:hypothetical protein OSSY52_22570 [Tepiditoga spiralis]
MRIAKPATHSETLYTKSQLVLLAFALVTVFAVKTHTSTINFVFSKTLYIKMKNFSNIKITGN